LYLSDFSKADSPKLSVLEHAQEFVATAASFKLASFYEPSLQLDEKPAIGHLIERA
jgi:hypothetical protein